MGLASKIKGKLTPDSPKSGDAQGGDTDMHPRGYARAASPIIADDAPMNYNGVVKPQSPPRGHKRGDSGIDMGRDSRFREHVDDDHVMASAPRPRSPPLSVGLVWKPLAEEDTRPSQRHVLLPQSPQVEEPVLLPSAEV